MKLSIIIPVYNVEQWVGRCLESCLNQDIPKDDYEIVVVNDGTKDLSIERVQEVQLAQIAQEGKTNIRIINRENGGLSAARNTGLKDARGEYVWFIDSDDWIEGNILKGLLHRAYSDKLDVLCFTFQYVYADKGKRKYNVRYVENGKVFRGPQFICDVGMPPAAWAAIYRRDYLQGCSVKFYAGILHEDQEFTPRAYCLAERIEFVDEIVYNYYQREGSIMKSNMDEKRCKDYLLIADSIYEFAQNYKKEINTYNVLIKKINFFVSQSLAFYTHPFFPISLYKKKPYYPLSLQGVNGKLKAKYLLANVSLGLYIFVHKHFFKHDRNNH